MLRILAAATAANAIARTRCTTRLAAAVLPSGRNIWSAIAAVVASPAYRTAAARSTSVSRCGQEASSASSSSSSSVLNRRWFARKRNKEREKELSKVQTYPWKVCIVGRPNVGKSTLYNRLIGRQATLVDDTPGLTRDWIESIGSIAELSFKLIDTAGLHQLSKKYDQTMQKKPSDITESGGKHKKPMNENDAVLVKAMLEQTERAVQQADIILFMYDAKEGLTSTDEHFALWLRSRAQFVDVIDSETAAENAAATLQRQKQHEHEEEEEEDIASKYAESDQESDGKNRNNSSSSKMNTPARELGPHSPKTVLLLANKTESDLTEEGIVEGLLLGFGEPIPISAYHNIGMAYIYKSLTEAMETLYPYRKPFDMRIEDAKEEDEEAPNESLPEKKQTVETQKLQFAIVGKPNVGKSSLLNAMFGETRVMTGPTPGVTRDSIPVSLPSQNKNIDFVAIDTAGIPGIGANTIARLEKVQAMSAKSSLNTIRYANVVALVIDITNGLYLERLERLSTNKTQRRILKASRDVEELCVQAVSNVLTANDISIAQHVVDEGRALMVLANKWDLVPSKFHEQVLFGFTKHLNNVLPQSKDVPVIPVSALTGHNVELINPKAEDVFQRWSLRIPTNRLNRWMRQLIAFKPPPPTNGLGPSIGFITQVNVHPPTFTLFCKRPDNMSDGYLRFFTQKIREEFGFEGIPIRVLLRTTTTSSSSSSSSSGSKSKSRSSRPRSKSSRSGKSKSSSASSSSSSSTSASKSESSNSASKPTSSIAPSKPRSKSSSKAPSKAPFSRAPSRSPGISNKPRSKANASAASSSSSSSRSSKNKSSKPRSAKKK